MTEHIAYPLARELKDYLSAGCVRIEIAGSLRRAKPAPGDIEIIAIPSVGVYEVRDLFDQVVERHAVNHLDQALDLLFDEGAWRFDPGNKKNGPNYKRLLHSASGIACDLFIVTDPRKWGILYTIRTGSGDFSKDMVTLARRLGWFVQHGLLHGHPAVLDEKHRVKECEAGEQCIRIKPTLEEADFFAALSVPYIEPRDRTTLVEALARARIKNELNHA